MNYEGFDFKFATKKTINEKLETLETKEEKIEFLEVALKIKEKYIARNKSRVEIGLPYEELIPTESFIHRLEGERDFISDHLEYIESISEKSNKTTSTRKKRKGNHSALHLAMDWLPEIFKELDDLEDPTHKDVLAVIKNCRNDFNEVPDYPGISFIKGSNNLNKTNIDKALTYIFNNLYTDKKIKEGTIKKRANEYGWW